MGAISAQAKGYAGILKTVENEGYTGSPDVEDVLAFAESNSITIKNADKIRAAYKAYRVEVLEESDAGVVIGVMDDGGEAELSDEDADAKEAGRDEEAEKRLRRVADRLAKTELEVKNLQRDAESRKSRVEVAVPGEKDFRRLQRKGATVFGSAKDAHAFGLWMISGTALGSRLRESNPARVEAAAKTLDSMGIKGSTTNFAAEGGAAVPTQFVPDMWDYQSEYGVARAECDIQPMSSDSAERPKNNGGDGAGFVARFKAEGSAVATSEMATGLVHLNAKILEVLGKISRELLDDSAVNLGEFAARSITTIMQKVEDECLFLGNGSATYGGIKGLANIFGSTATNNSRSVIGGDTMSAHTKENLTAVMAKLPKKYRTGAKFYTTPAGTSEIFNRILGAQGGVTYQETADNGFIAKALGHEIVEVEVMDSDIDSGGDKVDVYFGNLRAAAQFGDRQSISVETNPHRYWDEGNIGIKGYDRFDINVHESGSATEAGPVVALFQT